MMHYKKGKNVEEELTKEQIPIEGLPERFLWMHVKGGSRIFSLIEYAKKALEESQYRAMVWSGTGGGIGKTISCAEIMKKDYELHQVTRMCYRKVEEYWDPQQEGLEQIVATRNIPSIHILLSMDEVDPKTAGYQHSKTRTSFWMEGDSEGKIGGNARKGNYFTGPQLKKKPNKHFGDDKNGTSNGAATGGPGGSKGKNKNNKNKAGKPADESGNSGDKQKENTSGKVKNKTTKAKNSENNKQKVDSSAGDSSGKVPTGESSMET